MELFHLAEYILFLARPTLSIMDRTRDRNYSRCKLACVHKRRTAQSQFSRGDSHWKNRRSKPSEITLAGRWGRWWRERVSDTLAFTRKPPPNTYPLAFISKTFHCRFTVILSRISWSKLRGVDTGQADSRARADIAFSERFISRW